MSEKWIKIKGARQHNLQNIDLEIPRDKMVVITGISRVKSMNFIMDEIGEHENVYFIAISGGKFFYIIGVGDITATFTGN